MIAKVLKLGFLFLLVTSHKTLPFAYVVRFYYHAIQGFFLSRLKYLATKSNSFGYNSPKDLFTWVTLRSHASPLEIDMYMHKSNSTYFLDLDIARTKLLTRLLQKFWWACYDNDQGKFKSKHTLSNIPYTPVATVQCRFIKELKPFQKYDISSRILAWDDKWLFVLSKFVTKKKGEEVINAIALTKYVLKNGRITVAPKEYLEICGFLSEENDKINQKNYQLVTSLVDVQDLENVAKVMA
ncbi:uncharacterized protein SPAPADRAFT_136550 [Spathaspora passalidarum NRRL Y-27907]|uniref:Thioesterase n=1 Tax=Spathaspora passalidarum (strain NRRL Y-27907 / 11-Y1) TaxID=619300 RepID=G3AML9_SPAPN|nr:uncharacterized protein SPAPADRAFT_136550 [Spathaspora passalidarum NRRL Y-27907]EGW33463.1 hypothetical protein SPAPADRAFT_136550 [Spathaspora passalidarum NRRL Y-27907]